MKKFILGFILLAVIGTGYASFKFFYSPKNTTPGQHAAVLCNSEKHVCEQFAPAADGGSLKITVLTQTGAPAKDLEVDLGSRPGAREYYMKYTDKNGVAEFGGIPASAYAVYFNGNTFIKEYGSSDILLRVEIPKNQTVEKTIQLLPGK